MRREITSVLAIAGAFAVCAANAEAVLLVNDNNMNLEQRGLLKNGHRVDLEKRDDVEDLSKRALPNAAASPEEVFMGGQAYTDTNQNEPATPAFKMLSLSQQITDISSSIGSAIAQDGVGSDGIQEVMCPFVEHVASASSQLINGVSPSSDKATRDAAATLGQVVWSLYNATENLNLTCDGMSTMNQVIDKLQTNLDVAAVAAAARK